MKKLTIASGATLRVKIKIRENVIPEPYALFPESYLQVL